MKPPRLAIAAPLFLFALAGCATTGPSGPSPQPARGGAPDAPAFTRADIFGLSAADLDGLFGPAALVRREGKGEFRRYGLADCALIVILYPDETGEAVAGHVDAAATTAGADAPDLDQCLAKGLAPAN